VFLQLIDCVGIPHTHLLCRLPSSSCCGMLVVAACAQAYQCTGRSPLPCFTFYPYGCEGELWHGHTRAR
jgi:hypothetical protein